MNYKAQEDYLRQYDEVINQIITLLKENSASVNTEILKEVKRKINEASFLKEL